MLNNKSQKKLITLYVPSMRGGGAERVILNLAMGISEKNYNVDLILGNNVGEYKINESINVIDFKKNRTVKTLNKLTNYLIEKKPYALISAMTHTNIISIIAKSISGVDTKIIVTEHNTSRHNISHKIIMRKVILPFLVKRFYPLANEIVTVSKGLADELSAKLNICSDQINVIYNPLVDQELKILSLKPNHHPWLANEEIPVILGIGRLTLQKDFATLLKAFREVRNSMPVRLMILGEGEERSRLEQLARDLEIEKDVSMPGFVDNPYSYMARSSLVVLSSAWEGFGNILVEAMAVGTPVVSTDCHSGPAEILDHGKFGRLVPVGDVSTMAEMIIETINKSCPEGKKALVGRAAFFGREKSINEYLSLIDNSHSRGR